MPSTRRSTRKASSPQLRNAAQPYARANTRSGSPSTHPSTAVLSRSAAVSGKQSLKLTVKAAPSKLRQATSGSSIPPNPYAAGEPSDSDVTPASAARPTRSTRNPRTVVEPESEEDEDMEAAGEEEIEEDAGIEDIDQELLANADSDEDAEGEEDDYDAEEMQQDHRPPPIIKMHKPAPGQRKPTVTVSAPHTSGPLHSVEAKEIGTAGDEDEELSDLESGDENDPQNEDEIGIDIDPEDELDDDNDDEEIDSNSNGSRSATPDLTKLTRRQRGAFEDDPSLMALSNEALKKKVLTVEEHAMRRQEMARRRKNLSEKKNEEEKMDTINKLLQKQAPKRRTRAEILAAQLSGGMPGGEDEDGEYIKADPVFTRWVSSREGTCIGVPEEWLVGPMGEVFGGPVPKGHKRGGGRLIEEVA